MSAGHHERHHLLHSTNPILPHRNPISPHLTPTHATPSHPSVIPPGFDDLSAAVVMDSKPRPPPPPSPPSTRLTTCACPLTPPDTVGAPDAITCNGTYATMTARIANASTPEEQAAIAYQCVPWPNYGAWRVCVCVRDLRVACAWCGSCVLRSCCVRAWMGQATSVCSRARACA